MSRGRNNVQLAASPAATASLPNNHGHSASGGGHAQQQPQQQQSSGANAAQRRNKTLAWYISDRILDKNERDSVSPLARPDSDNRKNSLDSQQSSGSTAAAAPSHHQHHQQQRSWAEEEKRKRKETKQQQQQRSANKKAPSGGSTSNAAGLKESLSTLTLSDQHEKSGAAAMSGKERKEDYWYYDAVSDGFYYEHNGSRGWRKRNPKVHGGPLSAKAMGEEHAQKISMPIPVITSQPPQQSKFFPSSASSNAPSIKYYDAASDGFFYEMASIDGWKRRQPLSGTSPPGSNSSSQSQQQQRIFRPVPSTVRPTSNFVRPQQMLFAQQQQRVEDPSSFPPLSTHHYHHQQAQHQMEAVGVVGNGQQKKPMMPVDVLKQHYAPYNLSNSELEDMICLKHSKSAPLNIINGGQSAFNNVVPRNNQQQQPQFKPLFGEEASSASTTATLSSSLSSEEQSLAQQTPHNYGNFAASGGWQQPASYPLGGNGQSAQVNQVKRAAAENGDAGGNGIEINGHFRKTQNVVGSFDEPMSDYWMDAVDKKMLGGQSLPKCSSVLTKRPEYLKLNCGIPKSADVNETKRELSEPTANLPHFNVDKFIADLPIVDHDKILSSLSAFRTPMVDSRSTPFNYYPDSPLFTPVLLRENAWDRFLPMMGSNGSAPKAAAVAASQLNNGAVASLERGLKDIEKIWQKEAGPAF